MKNKHLVAYLLLILLSSDIFSEWVQPVGQNPIIKTNEDLNMLKGKNIPRSSENPIQVFAVVNEEFDGGELEIIGWKIVRSFGTIRVLEGDEKYYHYVKAVKGVISIRKSKKVYNRNNKVRELSQVDQLHLPQNQEVSIATGKGTIVSAIDSEFDIYHPAFLDKNGKSRFLGLYKKNKGFVNADDLESKASLFLDPVYHGTHVLATAAGSKFDDNPYYGMAYNASLIGGKLSPDKEDPADYAENVEMLLMDYIDTIFHVADSLKMPCVINMSMGSHTGPHDGTSELDQFIDSKVGPGRIIVGSAGNETGADIHVQFNLSDKVETVCSYPVPKFDGDGGFDTLGFHAIDYWGDINKNFSIGYTFIKGATNKPVVTTGYYTTEMDKEGIDTIYTDSTKEKIVSIIEYKITARNPHNNKPNMYVEITSDTSCIVQTKTIGDGILHCWTNESFFWAHSPESKAYGFNTHCVGEIGGTAKEIITVGSYASRVETTSWKNVISKNEETLHNISSFSSVGPTVDGRVKPDITAPGSMVVSAMSSVTNTPDGDPSIILWPDESNKKNRYCSMEGTSMSAPAVTGIISLMLEVNPHLTPSQIKEIFKKTALQDEFVAEVPSNTWGYGKVQAYGAVLEAKKINDLNTIPLTNKIISNLTYSNANKTFTLSGQTLPKDSRFVLYNLKGKVLYSMNLNGKRQVKLPKNLASAVYIVSIDSNAKSLMKTKFTLKN